MPPKLSLTILTKDSWAVTTPTLSRIDTIEKILDPRKSEASFGDGM